MGEPMQRGHLESASAGHGEGTLGEDLTQEAN